MIVFGSAKVKAAARDFDAALRRSARPLGVCPPRGIESAYDARARSRPRRRRARAPRIAAGRLP
ncbi:hypothetical protein EFP20_26410 [Burkholderia glumae]|nr:hypothetical protein EFP20_26410 [Burkholderia glumae]